MSGEQWTADWQNTPRTGPTMTDTPTPRPDSETRQRLAEAFARHRNPDLHGIGRNADIVVMPGEYAECYALADVALAEVASLTEDLAAARIALERLFEQRDEAIAERDELLRLRDKAVFWRESLSLVRQIDASDEELALAEALGLPIRIFTQPTEEAGSG